jgi:saposin
MHSRELRYSLRAGKDATTACSLVGFCGAAQHSRLPTAPTDFLCDVCQEVIRYIEQLLLDGLVKEEIEQLAAEFCDLFPTPISIWCKSFIDQYIDEIIAAIESGIDAFNICGQIGICDLSLRRPLFKSPSGTFCDTCKSLINYARQLLVDGYARDEIEALLTAACGDLGPLAGLCAEFLDGFADQIFDWIDQELDATSICSLIGVCSSSLAKTRKTHFKVSEKVPKTIMCYACQEAIVLVRKMVAENAPKEEIEAAVSGLCAALGPLQPVCASHLGNSLEGIVSSIGTGMDEAMICSRLNLCGRAKAKSTRRVFAKTPKKDELCDLCVGVVDYLKELVADGYSESEILALADDLCGLLPAPYSILCLSVVTQYGDEVYDWIVENQDSANICSHFEICPKPSAPRRAVKSKGHLTSLPAGVFCDACQDVVHFIESAVIDGFVPDEIEALVADLCNSLPSPLSAYCISLVDSQLESILAWIDEGIEAFDICGSLGLCGAEHARLPRGTGVRKGEVGPCAREPALCVPRPRRPAVQVQ